MARGRYGNISGRHVLGKKLTHRVPMVKNAMKKELERWELAQALRPKMSPEEAFIQREGISRITFDRVMGSYFKHAALKPQNISRAPDILAHEIAIEANIPYLKAIAFVGWANWALRERLKASAPGGNKPGTEGQKAL